MGVIAVVNLETGNLNQFSSSVTDSGDLSVTTAARLARSKYGMSVLIDDSTAIYGDLASLGSATGIVRFRFYINTNNLSMDNNASHAILTLRNTGAQAIGQVNLNYTTVSGFYLAVGLYLDSGSANFATTGSLSAGQNYLEFQLNRASGSAANDGSLQVWLNGSAQSGLSAKDNYDRFNNFDGFRIGAISGVDVTTTGTYYIDEIVVRDDAVLIGPVADSVQAARIKWKRKFNHMLVR